MIPTDIGNLISPFSKSSLNIWKFTAHVLLKPGLENFEHYFTLFQILKDDAVFSMSILNQPVKLDIICSFPKVNLKFT